MIIYNDSGKVVVISRMQMNQAASINASLGGEHGMSNCLFFEHYKHESTRWEQIWTVPISGLLYS